MSLMMVRVSFLAVAMFFFLSLAVQAEDFTNKINSVKVNQAGDNSVVVDVYINSSDTSVKPQLSSRKYKDDKYVIDLMNVTQEGSVSKDTSASSGLVNNKNIKVGKLPGGTARVLIDLENPQLEVKEVRYHVINSPEAPKTAEAKKPAEPTSPVALKPKEELKIQSPVVAVVKPVQLKQDPPKRPVSALKPQVLSKPEPPKLQPKVEQPKKEPEKPSAVVKSEEKQIQFPSPQVIHKTDSLVSPEKKAEKAEVTQPAVVKVASIPQLKVESTIKPAEKPKVEQKKSEPVVSNVKTDQKTNTYVEKKVAPEKPVAIESSKLPPEKNLIAQVTPEEKPEAAMTKPVDPEQMPVNLEPETNEANLKVVDVKGNDIDFMGLLLTLIGALVIVIPLIFIAVWLINIFYKGGDSIGLKTLSSMGGNSFKIISSTSLGQGKSIHLVEIKGRQLVIGCTANNINILTEFGDFDEFVEENNIELMNMKSSPAVKKYKRGRPPLGSFADLYKDYTSKLDESELEDEY